MVAAQKHAFFNVIIAMLALVLFFILLPYLGAARSQGAFAVLSLLALGPLFYRRKRDATISDERDELLLLRAARAGFIVFWLLFVFGVLGTYWFVFRSQPTMPSTILPGILWGAWVLFILCHGISLLICYERAS
jgi:hypothetical protein